MGKFFEICTQQLYILLNAVIVHQPPVVHGNADCSGTVNAKLGRRSTCASAGHKKTSFLFVVLLGIRVQGLVCFGTLSLLPLPPNN